MNGPSTSSLACERGRLEVFLNVEQGGKIAGFSGESFDVSLPRAQVEAAAQVHALLTRWSDRTLARHFDPSLDPAEERRRFDALRRDHGACKAPVARSLDSRGNGFFTLACEHGGDLRLRVRPAREHPGRVESFRLELAEPTRCPRP